MIGIRLKYLRIKNNLTQAELAKKIDVARTTYAMYEQNKREPDFETLNKLADLFEVSLDYLLGRTDNLSPSEKTENDFIKSIEDTSLKRWIIDDLYLSDEEDLKKLRAMWNIIKSDKK